jgi:hypothetical protein
MPSPDLLEFDVERWAPADVAADDPWRPTRAHEAWCAARRQWLAAGNEWPSGEDQRQAEEIVVMPDEPFCGNTYEHHCLGAGCPERPMPAEPFTPDVDL